MKALIGYILQFGNLDKQAIDPVISSVIESSRP